MLRSWAWVAAAIVAASLAAGLVTGVEAACFFVLPELGAQDGAVRQGVGAGAALAMFVGVTSIPCWAAGLTVLGLPLALALRRIGRDGYVTAVLAGALGGALALLIVLVVFGGLSAPSLLLTYPLFMILPGAVAGLIVRRLAYDARVRG